MFAILLVACGADTDINEKSHSKDIEKPDLTLPDSFPADFPIPENITITEVEDDSDDEQHDYSIKFDFDPDIDLEALIKLYADYTEKVGYTVLIGGEEFFADGIFQYGSYDPKTASNMFAVTLKLEDGVYGSIDVKFLK